MRLHACSFASASFSRQQKLQYIAFNNVGFSKDQIHIYDDSILGEEFTEKIPQANENNRYGFFCFKPYFIEKVLSSIAEGDILLYLDVNDCPRPGIIPYIQSRFSDQEWLNLLVTGTNYQNTRHMSWYHREHLAFELLLASRIICQPEAGALVVRNTSESRALLRAWFELTLMQALALSKHDDSRSRHDQETLYLMSRLNKSVHIESWWHFKLTGKGLREYIDWEAFRCG